MTFELEDVIKTTRLRLGYQTNIPDGVYSRPSECV